MLFQFPERVISFQDATTMQAEVVNVDCSAEEGILIKIVASLEGVECSAYVLTSIRSWPNEAVSAMSILIIQYVLQEAESVKFDMIAQG